MQIEKVFKCFYANLFKFVSVAVVKIRYAVDNAMLDVTYAGWHDIS